MQKANPAVASRAEIDGDQKSFQSKQVAEEFAEQLSRNGTRLQIQEVGSVGALNR